MNKICRQDALRRKITLLYYDACLISHFPALSLGTGLVVFASALSEALIEVGQYRKETPSGPDYDYQYGWCFFTAGAAFIMTKIAAVFSLSGHLNRYPSVDEMVSIKRGMLACIRGSGIYGQSFITLAVIQCASGKLDSKLF